jgi:hypothetical protein
MAKRKFPRRIYVTIDWNADGDEYLLARSSVETADVGTVGIYELVETLEKREVTELRRARTKTWFKSASL